MQFSGTVISGHAIGNPFGIATANLKVADSLKSVLREGVYFVQVVWEGNLYKGLLHFGERKTFGSGFSAEVHLLDFSGDLYGAPLEVQIKQYHRPIQTFANGDLLFTKIEEDIIQARKFFLRQQILSMWDTVTADIRQYWPHRVLIRMKQEAAFLSAQHILLYAPQPKKEVDFVSALCETYPDKTYYFPKVSENRTMDFYPAKVFNLLPGMFQIREPKEAIPVDLATIEYAFIPAVGVDPHGHRLGRGGGYYDRILSHLPCLKVAVLPSFAVVPEVPMAPWDQKLDKVFIL